MTGKDAIADVSTDGDPLAIRPIGGADLIDALAKGYADFKAVPSHLFFLWVIYPVVILIFARAFAGYELLPLLFPLFAGFTLIGPVVADRRLRAEPPAREGRRGISAQHYGCSPLTGDQLGDRPGDHHGGDLCRLDDGGAKNLH